jgi:hypothetical protein
VKRGEKRTHTFGFQNTGSSPVEIAIATSCACTTLTWPEGKIITPGMKERIKAVFDSTEKEHSETVDIDIILEQIDEKGRPIVYTLQYVFELVE